MMRRKPLVVALLVILSTAACTADSDEPSAAPPTATSSPTSAGPTPGEVRGLRGEPATSGSCQQPQSLPDETRFNPQPMVDIPAPRGFLICTSGGMAPVIQKGSPYFQGLVDALSKPDPKRQPTGCLYYADAPIAVIALTEDGSFRVYIPEDGCNHYQKTAKRAVFTSWPEG